MLFLETAFSCREDYKVWNYMSGGGCRAAIRVVQGMNKEQLVPKYGGDHSAGFNSALKDTACGGDVGGSMHARRFSGVVDSCSLKASKADEKLKHQAEESLRTVMYLSCWGPT
ncbi:uncharacterized protein LOC115997274 [Ipomoea triloba]|uniref:uncharacterized protein LOC115997274 n=1 Tax=Ipomoea triloba TaxID=35885 RepID=UPI00125D7616|nr:uncharacterized protein LOC115997274 [Ipomoea triloba]